jgi:hypothetical protein
LIAYTISVPAPDKSRGMHVLENLKPVSSRRFFGRVVDKARTLMRLILLAREKGFLHSQAYLPNCALSVVGSDAALAWDVFGGASRVDSRAAPWP